MAEQEMSEQEKLIADVAEGALAPGEVSDSLRPRIEELDLWRNVEELREQGATVVTDAVPLDLLDELRAVIHGKIESEGPKEGRSGVPTCGMLLGNSVVDRVEVGSLVLALLDGGKNVAEE